MANQQVQYVSPFAAKSEANTSIQLSLEHCERSKQTEKHVVFDCVILSAIEVRSEEVKTQLRNKPRKRSKTPNPTSAKADLAKKKKDKVKVYVVVSLEDRKSKTSNAVVSENVFTWNETSTFIASTFDALVLFSLYVKRKRSVLIGQTFVPQTVDG